MLDCLEPLRILITGAIVIAGVMVILHFHGRRGWSREEKTRRAFVGFFFVIAACASLLTSHFVAFCSAQALCRTGVDLNCSPGYPEAYRAVALVAGFSAVIIVLTELTWTLTAGSRPREQS